MVPRTLVLLFTVLLPCAALVSGCGLAESIAGNFVDDEDVVLPVNVARSGTIIRQTDGTDLIVQNGTFNGGDTLANHFCVCVCGFSIDASQQPGNTRIESATLRVWVEPDVGDPAALGPLVISHLPDHPDQALVQGMVPHPAGTEIGTIPDVVTPGMRAIDVTPSLLADWNAGRRISAFAVHLDVMTDGDAQADQVLLEAPGVRAELVLRFTLDL